MIGYLIGRVVVSFVLIPQYFRGELVTAYQLIERRFGQRLRSLTAGVFLVTRAAAEGVRVFAVAIVVRVALGGLLTGVSDFARDLVAIAIVTALTLLYTLKGGLKAAIWTDVMQQTVYVAGTIVGSCDYPASCAGRVGDGARGGGRGGQIPGVRFHVRLDDEIHLVVGSDWRSFLTTASHGTDQLIVQRLLAARGERQAKIALLSSGVVIFFQFSLFLMIGAMLYVFYRISPPAVAFTRTDTIFPVFIVSHMPHGVSGLLIAAILAAAMSNLSAALNSLSSTSMVDFYIRLRPLTSEVRRIWLSRAAMVVWALVLFGLALLARHGGRVIEVGLTIASIAYGGMLGVFLLGVLTRRASERGAMMGMICGLALNLYLWLFTSVAFTWYVVLGSVATFAVGYAASFAMGQKGIGNASA